MDLSSGELDQLLPQARELVDHLESGDAEQAAALVARITKLHETELFTELGKLTRELHDTLQNFHLDDRLSTLTATEIPDAKARLTHVIELTQNAADRTLNVVDDTLPRTAQLEQRATDLKRQWDRFRSRDMKVEEFRGLSREIDEFLAWTAENATLIHAGLSDVMMAQDFQDITGQIIRRVIKLVQEVEDNLVGLIRITGKRIAAKDESESQLASVEAVGPQVPGVDPGASVVKGQDDVDALLSSLGF